MNKSIKNIWQIGVIFLLAGCIPQPVQQLAPVLATQTPYVMYVTATSEAQNLTATPASTEVTPTATPAAPNASITLTKIDDQGGGKAIIQWTMEGNFPSGYVIVWSMTDQHPTYPADQYVVAGDPASRSAMVTLNMKKIYYLRVCRLVGGNCDVYSNLGIFALVKKAGTTSIVSSGNGGSTPQSIAYSSDGSVVNSSTSIAITSIVDGGSGKARINWTGTGDFPSGFKILYSTSSATPFVGGYPYYAISSGSTRSAYVDGASGTKYYFRICRTTGTTCDIYSNSYAYTFPGSVVTSTPKSTPVVTSTPDLATIAITSIVAAPSLGSANITWTDVGSFPEGFKVLASPTNTQPTISNTVATVGSGATGATFSGLPDTNYYVRVCKVYGSICSAYSDIQSFTFAADTASLTISVADTSSGNASVSWTPSGSFPEGYKVLMSATNNPPLLLDAAVIVTNEATHTAPINGTPGSTYHIAVCKIYGSICSAFSSTTDFTFGQITLSGFTDGSSGEGIVDWTAAGDFPNGFKVLYSSSNANPTLSDTVVDAASPSAVNASVTGTAGTAYHFRVCKYDGVGACVLYSPVVDYTFASVP